VQKIEAVEINNGKLKILSEVKFDVQIDKEDLFYPDGNYATISESGYYMISYRPEASAMKKLFLNVKGGSGIPVVPEVLSAEPTSSKVMINGKTVDFEAYNINGNNYFKLRDIAKAITGSEKNFEVGWDEAKNAISLTSGKAYTSAGGELVVSVNPTAKEASLSTSKIYLDGKEVQLTAYTIGGNNYFKLRDIAKAINFAVTWNEETNTIGIDTKAVYAE